MLGAIPVVVDASGLVTGTSPSTGGYDGANGDETVATQVTVDPTSPANQTAALGASATFSVTATGDSSTGFTAGIPDFTTPGNADTGLRYEWFIGDPDLSGTPILASDTNFSGESTADLVVNNVTGLDGTEFFVQITHENNVCLTETASATLTIAPVLCTDILAGTMDVCAILLADPSNPVGLLDCDGDGVTNAAECANGTDPSDSCDFTASDITLPQMGAFLGADCDGDGVTNGIEIANGSDPADPCDLNLADITLAQMGDYLAADCDGDGVTNGDELANGSNPNDPCDFDVSVITLPQMGDFLDADCDGDGVTNGDEINAGTDPADPCSFDIAAITVALSGDYLAADCDGDGVTNGDEIAAGTDPADPCSFDIAAITVAQSGDYLAADCDGDGCLLYTSDAADE